MYTHPSVWTTLPRGPTVLVLTGILRWKKSHHQTPNYIQGFFKIHLLETQTTDYRSVSRLPADIFAYSTASDSICKHFYTWNKIFHYHNFLLVFQTQKLRKKIWLNGSNTEPSSERDRFSGRDDSTFPDANSGWAWQWTTRFAFGRTCRLGSTLDLQPHSPQRDGKIQHHLGGMLLPYRASLSDKRAAPQPLN